MRKGKIMGDKEEYFEQYWRHASVLRNWFVLFGIGCCVLLINGNPDVFEKISSKNRGLLVVLLLSGISSQIVLALINKWTQWVIYRGEDDDKFSEKKISKSARSISEKFWIDVICDIISVLCFGISIAIMALKLC